MARRRESWSGLETLVGFRSHRLLDYVRFEAKATALGLNPGLRATLAEQFRDLDAAPAPPRRRSSGVDAATILDIVESNFRLGVAVRGGVAEHHLAGGAGGRPGRRPVREPSTQDGQPDFDVDSPTGAASSSSARQPARRRYKNGDYKVEAQKTRDSGAGRKYTYDQFDVLAACLFSATGIWEFRFRWTNDLEPWSEDPARIAAIQRIDDSWASSLNDAGRS